MNFLPLEERKTLKTKNMNFVSKDYALELCENLGITPNSIRAISFGLIQNGDTAKKRVNTSQKSHFIGSINATVKNYNTPCNFSLTYRDGNGGLILLENENRLIDNVSHNTINGIYTFSDIICNCTVANGNNNLLFVGWLIEY